MAATRLKQFLLLPLLLIYHLTCSVAQESDSGCKVLVKEISGSYKGSCHDGLADGKGFASGEDTYSGNFRNGLPDGKGVYTYKNGNVFSGFWNKGIRNGKGKYTYFVKAKPTVVTGYWKNGDYYGKSKPDDEFRVNVSGIEDYSIVKTAENVNLVEITFEKDLKKFIPEFIKIEVSSGHHLEQPAKILIRDYTFPMTCSLQFSIPVFGQMKLCNFTFTILKPGKYEVLIMSPL